MEWQPIETAPRDYTPVLIATKPHNDRAGYWSQLTGGVQFVGRHPGIQPDGFDPGWDFAAPVGYGGIMDDQIAGWMPLPSPPSPALAPTADELETPA